MEQNSSNQVSSPDAKAEVQRGNSKKREDEENQSQRSYFFKEGLAKYSISLGYDVDSAKEPDKGGCKQEENYWLSENPDHHSLYGWHTLILLLAEENCLREVQSIQISKVLMMMIMPVPPCLEWEMHIDTEKTADHFIEANGTKVAKMGHVMELHKNPYDYK